MIKRIYFLNIRLETGGPENIHQVCRLLSDLGYDASILYPDKDLKHTAKFECYNNKIAENPIFDDETLLVFPEFLAASRFKNFKCKKALFWLSLDNSPDIKQLRLKEYLEQFGVNYNLVQCQYAYDYLKSYDIENVFMISDYVNDKYFEARAMKERKPQILYNPKKGKIFTQKIVHLNQDLTFIPIENMNVDQIIDLMDESMVYIDFGEHPGKDRIPREAAMRSLVVVTGRDGAAVNDVDVNIPQKYKIDRNISQLGKVKELLHSCIENYSAIVNDFNSYREKIMNEKAVFRRNVEKAFKEIISC